MALNTIQSTISKAVLNALESEVEKVKEECIKSSVEKFEKDLRKAIGNVAISIHEFYQMEVQGPNLVITIKDYRNI